VLRLLVLERVQQELEPQEPLHRAGCPVCPPVELELPLTRDSRACWCTGRSSPPDPPLESGAIEVRELSRGFTILTRSSFIRNEAPSNAVEGEKIIREVIAAAPTEQRADSIAVITPHRAQRALLPTTPSEARFGSRRLDRFYCVLGRGWAV
jgi:hypothetical protein